TDHARSRPWSRSTPTRRWGGCARALSRPRPRRSCSCRPACGRPSKPNAAAPRAANARSDRGDSMSDNGESGSVDGEDVVELDGEDDLDEADDYDDDVDDADLDDEVGAEGNRIVGVRARAVVEHVARSLADDPDEIDVDVRERNGEATLLVHAAPGD